MTRITFENLDEIGVQFDSEEELDRLKDAVAQLNTRMPDLTPILCPTYGTAFTIYSPMY